MGCSAAPAPVHGFLVPEDWAWIKREKELQKNTANFRNFTIRQAVYNIRYIFRPLLLIIITLSQTVGTFDFHTRLFKTHCHNLYNDISTDQLNYDILRLLKCVLWTAISITWSSSYSTLTIGQSCAIEFAWSTFDDLYSLLKPFKITYGQYTANQSFLHLSYLSRQ